MLGMQGLKASLDASMTVKGLLEMMFMSCSEWIDCFLDDIECSHNVTPRPASRRASFASGAVGGCEPLLLRLAAWHLVLHSLPASTGSLQCQGTLASIAYCFVMR